MSTTAVTLTYRIFFTQSKATQRSAATLEIILQMDRLFTQGSGQLGLWSKHLLSGGTHYDWAIYDSGRSPTNPIGAVLEANQTQAEVTGTGRGLPIDFVSNGFKLRSSYAESNAAVSYIYLAFAEQPFKFSNAR